MFILGGILEFWGTWSWVCQDSQSWTWGKSGDHLSASSHQPFQCELTYIPQRDHAPLWSLLYKLVWFNFGRWIIFLSACSKKYIIFLDRHINISMNITINFRLNKNSWFWLAGKLLIKVSMTCRNNEITPQHIIELENYQYCLTMVDIQKILTGLIDAHLVCGRFYRNHL